MESKVVIQGCYDNRNFGDKLLLDILSSHCLQRTGKRPICPWIHREEEKSTSAKAGSGIRDCFSSKIAIFGGGGYLHDGNGKYSSIKRLLKRYAGPSSMWRLTRTPYIVVGPGSGPLSSPLGKWAVRTMLNGAEVVTVRDDASREILLKAGVESGKIEVTADLACICTPDNVPQEAMEKALRLVADFSNDKKLVGIHFSSLTGYAEKLEDLVRTLGDAFSNKPELQLVWLFDHGQSAWKQIAPLSQVYTPTAKMIPVQPHWVMMGLLKQFDAIFTSKLHVGIAGWCMGVPVCGYSSHIKSRRFYEQIGRLNFHEDCSSPPSILKEWIECLYNSPAEFRKEDESSRVLLRRLAQKNLDVVDDFLEKYRIAN